MALIQLATFLAGSLLTLLLPIALLLALTVWYVRFVLRAPETPDGREPAPPPTANPAPTTAPGAGEPPGEG